MRAAFATIVFFLALNVFLVTVFPSAPEISSGRISQKHSRANIAHEQAASDLRLARPQSQRIKNSIPTATKDASTPIRRRLSRREELKGFMAASLTAAAAAASKKANAEEALARKSSSNEMQSVSSLQFMRRSLKATRSSLRQRQQERESYTKGAPAAIIATGSHSLAGATAGAISTVVLHPIDTIKTRLQKGAANISEAIAEGNLYNGLTSNLLKEAPNSAIYMTVVEAIQKILLQGIPQFPLLALFVAGGVGDLIGSICRVPAEMLNKRLQTGLSPDIGHAFGKTFFTPEGRQLTRETWGIVVLRDVPHGAFQYMVFLGAHAPIAAGLAALHLPVEALPFLGDAVPGAVAGAIASYVTTPADVMVTNFATYQSPETSKEPKEQATTIPSEPTTTGSDGVMSLSTNSAAGANVDLNVPTKTKPIDLGKRPTLAGVGKEVLERDGLEGFMVGSVQRAVYYAPMTGVFFGLYEALDKVFYPNLLPALSSPVVYQLSPGIANAIEGTEQKIVETAIKAISLLEHTLTG